jgi:flagellar biosynthetic protein FliR
MSNAITTLQDGGLITGAAVLGMIALRMCGLMLAAPVFGHRSVPVKLRIAVGLMLSLGVLARSSTPAWLPGSTYGLVLSAVGELALGVGVGLLTRVIFVGVQLGAVHVSQQMGIAASAGLASQELAGGGSVRGLFGILAAVMFLATGGHRLLIDAVLGLYEKLPAARGLSAQTALNAATSLLAGSFVLALNLAGPVLVAMLLATVLLGVLQRTLPQCSLLAVQLPARTAVALLAMVGAIAVLRPLMVTAVETLWREIVCLA